jgi:hypothetical protein
VAVCFLEYNIYIELFHDYVYQDMKEKNEAYEGRVMDLPMCVSGVPADVMSDITYAGTLDTHTHRQHTATYQIDEASRLKE